MRIGGMASGFDTEQMVKDMMRVESMRVDKFFKQEETLKWKREALNVTNKTLADFILNSRKDFGLTRTTSTGTVLKTSTQSLDWVKKVSSSDESAVKATASANAMAGSHKIEVEQLAEVATMTSVKISGFKVEDETKNLVDSNGNFKIDHYGTLNINGVDFTIGAGVGEIATVNDLVSKINNTKFTINGEEMSLRAAYDKTLGQLMINTKEMGVDQVIDIKGDIANGDLSNKLFGGDITIAGKNAIVHLNGDKIDTMSSNNFSIFGINFQLQSKTVGVVTVNVESNVDGIFDKVKGFVDEYNKVLDNLNGLLNQKAYRDFKPLTKEEREVMKDKEIEMWEEKAKSGLLRGDETISRTLQTMRNGLYENVYSGGTAEDGGKGTLMNGFNHLTQLGITTGNYQSGGKLEINEEKLRAAINENPEGVVEFLFKTSDITVPAGNDENAKIAAANKRANSGIVERLYNDMIDGMKDVVRRSGTGEHASLFRNVQSNMLIDFVTSGSISMMDKDIMDIGTRISKEQRLMAGREDRYWRQFTAMEKAMEKMNQQSGWLSSQMGQMMK